VKKSLTLFCLFFAFLAFGQNSIEELQKQVNLEVKSKTKKEYFGNMDEGLDLICKKNGLDKKDTFPSLGPGDGLELGNYEEFLLGLKRHKAPHVTDLQLAKKRAVCDYVVSLNAECELLKIDPNKNGIVDSKKEEVTMISRASELGLKDYHIRGMLHFYKDYGKICLNAEKESWHTVIPVISSTSSMKEIFQALELIYEQKLMRKNVCFHCHAGKHRTGIVAMLIILADLDESIYSDEDKMEDEIMPKIVQNYYEHTWNGKCSTKSKVVAALTVVKKSVIFKEFRQKWQSSFKL